MAMGFFYPIMKKVLLFILPICFFACERKGIPQGWEQPARLLQIDTAQRLGDNSYKTLTFQFIIQKDYYQLQFVPMFDSRLIGHVYYIPRPLYELAKPQYP